jgi:pimeloyl-ACP methyl ester carboxylesterase
MSFFRAYQALHTTIPTYFIESTAPNNVDDTTAPKPPESEFLQAINSDEAVRQIADALISGSEPNLVVMVHGFNNPEPAVIKMYTGAAKAIARDGAINTRHGLVCVGYRWPSESMGTPLGGSWDALPTLAGWLLFFGGILFVLSLPLYLFASLGAVHLLTMLGWTVAGLVLMAVLLRAIVYFRDNYRASNYGIPDLIQVIRAIDSEIVRLQRERGRTDPPRNVQLSFIGHSMGGFVVTNTIRTLSDVFAQPVSTLNSYGAGASADLTPAPPSNEIGNVFRLMRFVLASPDIPAETLMSSRGNFLASALSRFQEAYLFSNEGDEVLRQISTLANYFMFPTRSKNHGFRLGNVEILSRNYGLIDVSADDCLKALRVGNLTLQQLYDSLADASAQRQPDAAGVQSELAKIFTYFDCTDYVDRDALTDAQRPLLTFAWREKRQDPQAKLRWYAHIYLLLAYLVRHQKPDVHGGYFEGLLSQELIYRLACLGYNETINAYGTEAALGTLCEGRQIRALVSPLLRPKRGGSLVPPPASTAPTPTAPAPTPQTGGPAAPGSVTTVPSLVGQSILEARAAIAAIRNIQAGQAAPGRGYEQQVLLLEITREAPGQTPGTVLRQTPEAGTAVTPHMVVEVAVAK